MRVMILVDVYGVKCIMIIINVKGGLRRKELRGYCSKIGYKMMEV